MSNLLTKCGLLSVACAVVQPLMALAGESGDPNILFILIDDLHQWQKDINAGMPTPNPNFDPLRENEMAKDWWKVSYE